MAPKRWITRCSSARPNGARAISSPRTRAWRLRDGRALHARVLACRFAFLLSRLFLLVFFLRLFLRFLLHHRLFLPRPTRGASVAGCARGRRSIHRLEERLEVRLTDVECKRVTSRAPKRAATRVGIEKCGCVETQAALCSRLNTAAGGATVPSKLPNNCRSCLIVSRGVV